MNLLIGSNRMKTTKKPRWFDKDDLEKAREIAFETGFDLLEYAYQKVYTFRGYYVGPKLPRLLERTNAQIKKLK